MTPSSQTKISFTDSGSEGIALAWAEGDSFSVYEVDGEWVDDYTVSDLANSTFAAVYDNGITDEVSYVAVYPARESDALTTYEEYMALDRTSQQSQEASALDHLNDACVMSDTFEAGENITFAHHKAILTITFASGAVPSQLVFTDSASKSYELTISGVDVAESYTANIMIDPVEVSAERSLDFVVAYNAAEAQEYSVESSMSYVAGYRYSAPIAALSTTGYTAIYTADDLIAYLASPTTNAALMNDIDLESKAFTTAELNTSSYSKTFNGNGYTISNFTYAAVDYEATEDSDESQNAAMFRTANSTAIIKNLNFVDPIISGVKYVAVIVGDSKATITNCSVVGGSVTAAGITGGLAAQNAGTISGCYYEGDVINSSSNTGGLVGYNNAGTISNCTSAANVVSQLSNTGGVCGVNTSASLISGCVFTGVVDAQSETLDTPCGGIAGTNSGSSVIENCLSDGTVSSAAGKSVGGIVGYTATATVTGCTHSGSVTNAAVNLGGIVGQCDAATIISNCHNSGVVTSTAGSNTGGILGSGGATLTGCVNSGTISSATTYVGAIAGNFSGVATACYNIGEIASAGNRNGGIAGEGSSAVILAGCFEAGTLVKTNALSAAIIGAYSDGSTTITDCYYVTNMASQTNECGTDAETISGLNSYVDAMNAAIEALVEEGYTADYIFEQGADPEVDVPTIVAR
ncbi:MAG: GLUG motif-containing protein [Rikenellaceae bacterium]